MPGRGPAVHRSADLILETVRIHVLDMQGQRNPMLLAIDRLHLPFGLFGPLIPRGHLSHRFLPAFGIVIHGNASTHRHIALSIFDEQGRPIVALQVLVFDPALLGIHQDGVIALWQIPHNRLLRRTIGHRRRQHPEPRFPKKRHVRCRKLHRFVTFRSNYS